MDSKEGEDDRAQARPYYAMNCQKRLDLCAFDGSNPVQEAPVLSTHDDAMGRRGGC